MPCAIKRMCLKPRACAGLLYSPAQSSATKMWYAESTVEIPFRLVAILSA